MTISHTDLTKNARNDKILFLIHYPPPINGAAVVGRYIMESRLLNESFDSDYINLSTSMDLKDIKKFRGSKIISLFKIYLRILNALFNKKYNLCYMTLTASGPGFYKDLTLVFILKLFRIDIVYHFHNKGVSDSIKTFTLNKLLYGFVFRSTKSILLSPLLYYDIKDFVDEKNVFFCPNGLPAHPNIFKNRNLSQEKKRIINLLFLSNMMMEKGVYVLLQACKLLKQKGVKFKCNYVGSWSDISEEAFFKMVKSLALENEVFAHGPKYNAEKLAFYRDADLFIFPTYYHNETFGLVNLEAMQASLPIISTFEGGIPDVILDGVTGYLVEQKNHIQLAEKVIYLSKNPELRVKMGEAGRNRYEKLFTLEIFERNLHSILSTLVNRI